jgi:hypothetical protein
MPALVRNTRPCRCRWNLSSLTRRVCNGTPRASPFLVLGTSHARKFPRVPAHWILRAPLRAVIITRQARSCFCPVNRQNIEKKRGRPRVGQIPVVSFRLEPEWRQELAPRAQLRARAADVRQRYDHHFPEVMTACPNRPGRDAHFPEVMILSNRPDCPPPGHAVLDSVCPTTPTGFARCLTTAQARPAGCELSPSSMRYRRRWPSPCRS